MSTDDRVTTFIICPGCGTAYSRKGLAPHVWRSKGQPCRDAYERAKRRDAFREIEVPRDGTNTWNRAQEVARALTDG